MARTIVMGIRSPSGIKSFLQHYDQFREQSPLPDDWTAELDAAIQAAEGNTHAAPEIIFRDGSLTVTFDLMAPSFVAVEFRDDSGKGLTPPEMFELVKTLVGADVVLDDLEDEHREDLLFPAEPGQPWVKDFSFAWKTTPALDQ